MNGKYKTKSEFDSVLNVAVGQNVQSVKISVGQKCRRSKLPSVKNAIGQNGCRSKIPSLKMAVGQSCVGQKTWNRQRHATG
jgi:hypothetical protein